MPIVEHMNWDDVRVFLATLRAGSLRQAAQDLRISRPTAGRRLDALEARLGLKLFERAPDGLHATAEAVALTEAAEGVERAMLAMERAAQAADSELRGPVRVTMPAVVASMLLMDDLVAFQRKYPQIDLHISGSYALDSLANREADVAIRFMPLGKAPDPELTGRKAATAYMAVYGDGDCWMGQLGGERDDWWVKETPWPDLPVRGAIANGEILLAAARAGMGMTYIPCFMGDPHLPRRTEPKPGMDVWVLVHPDLKRTPRLRLFRDMIVAALKRLQPELEGRGDFIPWEPSS